MWTYLDRRARRLGILDTNLSQGALCVLFAIRPLLTFSGDSVDSGT